MARDADKVIALYGNHDGKSGPAGEKITPENNNYNRYAGTQQTVRDAFSQGKKVYYFWDYH